MSETRRSGSALRSVLAVLVGIVVGVVLSLGTDVALHMTHVFPPYNASMVGYDARSCWQPSIAPFTVSPAATLQPGSRPIGPCCTPWCSAVSW
jgi:hypothetical protein